MFLSLELTVCFATFKSILPVSMFHLFWLKSAFCWVAVVGGAPGRVKGEQGTAEFGATTVLKQTNELCF